MNYVRTKVSGNKQRLIQGKYNLDLTYITPRIIAMGFPGSGIKTIYRNNINDVADFFNEKHAQRFLIINISGNEYDTNKFQGSVLHINQWKDHHAPPLYLLFELIDKIFGFLFISKSNIVVINCIAGKGRTGSLICSFLLYSKCFQNTQDVFDYYSLKRLKRGNGLTQALQRRYVNYFFSILQSNKYPIPILRKLKQIRITCSPYLNINQIVPEFYIYNNVHKLIYSNCKDEKCFIDCDNVQDIIIMNNEDGIVLFGDVLIELFHIKGIFSKKKKMGRITFNTAFIDINENEVKFKINEIDPYKFVIKPNVNKDYEIVLVFESRCQKDKECIRMVEDLCEECKQQMKEEIDKVLKCQSIVNKYVVGDYDGKRILFGKNEIDIEKTLQNRNSLENINDIINGQSDESLKKSMEDELNEDNGFSNPGNAQCIII